MARNYQICSRCIMDTTDPDIRFNDDGFCNHCKHYENQIKQYVFSGEDGNRRISSIVARIKKDGRGKPYDCVLGLSGGVDSTYVAYLAKQLGLRPYLTVLDNGYDFEITKRNVQRIADYLGTELHICKIEPAAFRDLQLAYLKSGAINIEVLTDQAIQAMLYRTAARLQLRYVLSGTNLVTEAIMPASWGNYSNMSDLVNITDIYRRHGSGLKLTTFPTLSTARMIYYHWWKRIRFVSLLNYATYVKKDAKALFASEFNYEDYGPKHCESIITRFYQFYILPRRLGVDKRRAHLSCLVMSHQMTRDEALAELSSPPYTEEELRQDMAYVLEHLGLNEDELESLLSQPVRSHREYKTDWAVRLALISVYFNPRSALYWLVGRIRGEPW